LLIRIEKTAGGGAAIDGWAGPVPTASAKPATRTGCMTATNRSVSE